MKKFSLLYVFWMLSICSCLYGQKATIFNKSEVINRLYKERIDHYQFYYIQGLIQIADSKIDRLKEMMQPVCTGDEEYLLAIQREKNKTNHDLLVLDLLEIEQLIETQIHIANDSVLNNIENLIDDFVVSHGYKNSEDLLYYDVEQIEDVTELVFRNVCLSENIKNWNNLWRNMVFYTDKLREYEKGIDVGSMNLKYFNRDNLEEIILISALSRNIAIKSGFRDIEFGLHSDTRDYIFIINLAEKLDIKFRRGSLFIQSK